MGCQPKQEKTPDIKPEESLENLQIMSTTNNTWELHVSSARKVTNAYRLNLVSLESQQTKIFAKHGSSKALKEFEFFDIKGSHKEIRLEMDQGYFLSKDNLLKGKNIHLKSELWELEAERMSGYYPLKKLELKRVKGTYQR